MRRSLILFLLFNVVFAPLIRRVACSALSHPNPDPKISKHLNSLLPLAPKNDVAIIVDLEGKVYLVDTSSNKIISSWSSGLPIYSSYRNFTESESGTSEINASDPINEFVDCDDNWQLYVNSKTYGKVKLSAEEYVRNTPIVSEDGVTLGSRRTTVFLVDAKSGKLIHSYKLADYPSTTRLVDQNSEKNQLLLKQHSEELAESGLEGSETVEHLLYIMRTDYELQHYSPMRQLLWNVAFAEFDASFGFPSSGNDFGAKYMGDSNSPLPHWIKPAILRTRDPNVMELLSKLDSVVNGIPGGSPLPNELPRDRPLPNGLPGGRQLPLPAPFHSLAPVAFGQYPVASKSTTIGQALALPSSETESFGILGRYGSRISEMIFISAIAETIARFHLQYFVPFLPILLSVVAFVLYRYIAFRKQNKLNKVAEEINVQAGVPKKKKSRRLGNKKNNANNEKSPIYTSDDYKVGDGYGLLLAEGSEIKSQLTFPDIVDEHLGVRRIGKLVVSRKAIANGSNGTVVLEGIYDGRSVAVKRLVRSHHDVALKEIRNLIASDRHPNIVRWYGVEYDEDFVYLSLERCTCSLNDLIYLYSESFQSQIMTKDQDSESVDEYTHRLHSILENNKDIELWKANGYPTPQLLKLMRDVVSGVAHLHELGIIHRDLKPQNVLIDKDKFFSAKLSDMGISKRLPGDRSSITQHATGYGSSGWQAPEQLLHERQTRAVDLFSLGCLLFFCVTGGKHPYGDSVERDVNILNDRKDLFLVENMSEAVDLFTRLLDRNPDLRPKAMDTLHHPFFWSSETRLSFLRDASDRVELEDRENGSQLLNALESTAAVALNGKWDEKLETAFINNIGRYRRYKYDSVRDLLRVVRNKLNHYRELPQEIQELLGGVPEGFDNYFSSRFPRLLIEVYKVMRMLCREEEFFLKYITSNLI